MAWSSRACSRSLLLVTLALLAGGGCGGGSLSLDELYRRVFDAVCRYAVACDQMPDMATCLATEQGQPNYMATLKQDIASGKVKYDAAKASTCADLIDRVYAAGCSRTALAAVVDRDTTVCDQVFVGTVAAGGVCFTAEECADNGSCIATDPNCLRQLQCCSGTCMARTPTVPIGGSCASGDTCANGSYCDTSAAGVTGTCVVPSAGAGASCTGTSTQCAAPLYCDVVTGSGTGTCTRPAATGGPCNTSMNYASCDDGRDYCDQATATCTRRVRAGGDCSTGQVCAGTTTCVGSTCMARPRPGEACNATNGPSCLGSVPCDAATSTCVIPPAGAACM